MVSVDPEPGRGPLGLMTVTEALDMSSVVFAGAPLSLSAPVAGFSMLEKSTADFARCM